MGSNERRRRATRRQILFFIAFLALVAWGYVAFSDRLLRGEGVTAHFVSAAGSKSESYFLEVVTTPAERAKGLMFRKPGEMDADEGMIFVMPEEVVQRFFMKNTYIPLDMIFVDSAMKVVGILHEVPILNEQIRSVERPSKYVVELLGGEAKRSGISEGSTLVLDEGLPTAP